MQARDLFMNQFSTQVGKSKAESMRASNAFIELSDRARDLENKLKKSDEEVSRLNVLVESGKFKVSKMAASLSSRRLTKIQ